MVQAQLPAFPMAEQTRQDVHDRIMAAVPIGSEGAELRHRIARHRTHLFEFTANRNVPATNNVSERQLRPSVIFRKVTNGFRSEWGAATYEQ